jgi:hypothetical protein
MSQLSLCFRGLKGKHHIKDMGRGDTVTHLLHVFLFPAGFYVSPFFYTD